MRSRELLASLVLAVVLLSCDAKPLPPPATATRVLLYRGEPLCDWLPRIEDLHFRTRQDAELALVAFGGKAVADHLVPLLGHDRPEIVASAREVLGWLDCDEALAGGLEHRDPRVRVWCADLLLNSRAGAGSGSNIQREALDRVGPDPEALREALAAGLKDEHTRLLAALILCELGVDPGAAAPVLRETLDGDNGDDRLAAARALARAGIEKPRAVEVLVELLLTEECWPQKIYVARCLEDVGPAARAAIPGLEALAVLEGDRDEQEAARRALASIRGD